MDPSSPASAAPRVSVLMPTYRQAHFIRRALDSLLAQTLVDWEALIVDDGSVLRDGGRLGAVRARAWHERRLFTFEHHAPGLIDFFRTVIKYAGSPGVSANVRLPAAGLPVRAAVPRPAAQPGQPVPPPEAA